MRTISTEFALTLLLRSAVRHLAVCRSYMTQRSLHRFAKETGSFGTYCFLLLAPVTCLLKEKERESEKEREKEKRKKMKRKVKKEK